jgi:hypothetical protein
MQNRERALLGEPPLGTLEQGEPATDEEIEGEELESKVQEDWVNAVKPLMDAGCCLYICEGRMDRMVEARQAVDSEYRGRPYQMMRRAMGKADGMVAGLLHAGAEEGELENKLLRSWEDLTRGNAFACWCEERMQELASAYERDVLNVRRCIRQWQGQCPCV